MVKLYFIDIPPNKTRERRITMEDFLKFKKMITPVIIQVLFWIGVAVSVIMGLGMIISGRGGVAFAGLLYIILGPIITRIYCEILIIIFSINDTLTDMKNLLKDKTIS